MVEIVLMLWVFLAAFGFGALLLRLFPAKYSSLEHFVFSAGLGFGVIAYLMMVLGVFGLWYKQAVYVLLIILSIVGFNNIKSLILKRLFRDDRARGGWTIFSIIIGSILLGHFVINLVGNLAPPLNGDTLGLYLVWPKLWVQNHAIFMIDAAPWSYMPANTQMLSSLGLLLSSDSLSQLFVGWLMGVLATATVYAIARKEFSREISLLAATIFYCIPVVAILACSAKNDLLMAFFELLALYSFLNFFYEHNERDSLSWFLLSAVFCGFSVGTKYLFFSCIVIVCGIIVHYFKSGNLKKNMWRYIRYAGYFIGIVSVIGLPIYIRNIIYLGNPFYPLLSDVFNTGLLFWTLHENEGIIGYFATLWRWSILPERGYSVGPVFMFSIPLLLFSHKISSRTKMLLVIVFAHTVLACIISTRPRHILSSIGLLSVAASFSITKIRDAQKIAKYAATVFVVGIFIFNFLMVSGFNLLYYPKIPYILGSMTREEFLRQSSPKSRGTDYATVEFINKTLPSDARVLIVGPFHPYYVNKTTVYGWDAAMIKDEMEIKQYLEQKQISHIFVNPNAGYKTLKKVSFSKQLLTEDYLRVFRGVFNNSALFSENFVKEHLELIFTHNKEYLFRLK